MTAVPSTTKTPSRQIIKELQNNEFYRLDNLGKKIVKLQGNGKQAIARLLAFRLVFESCIAAIYQTIKLSAISAGVVAGIALKPAVALANRIVLLDKTTSLPDCKITLSRVGRGDSSRVRRKLAHILPKILKSFPEMGHFIGTIVKIAKLAIIIPLSLTVGLISPDAMLHILHKFKIICVSDLAKVERQNAIIEQAETEEGSSLKIARKNRLIDKINKLEVESSYQKLIIGTKDIPSKYKKAYQTKLDKKRNDLRLAYKRKKGKDIFEDPRYFQSLSELKFPTSRHYEIFLRKYNLWNLTAKEQNSVFSGFHKEYETVKNPFRANERVGIEFELVEQEKQDLENRLIKEWLSIEKGEFIPFALQRFVSENPAKPLDEIETKEIKQQVSNMYFIKKNLIEALKFGQSSKGKNLLKQENEKALDKMLLEPQEFVIARSIRKASSKKREYEILSENEIEDITKKVTASFETKRAIYKIIKFENDNLELDLEAFEKILQSYPFHLEDRKSLGNFAFNITDVISSEITTRLKDRETLISHRQQLQIHLKAMQELIRVTSRRDDEQGSMVHYTDSSLVDPRFLDIESRQEDLLDREKYMIKFFNDPKESARSQLVAPPKTKTLLSDFNEMWSNVEVTLDPKDQYRRWTGVKLKMDQRDETIIHFVEGKQPIETFKNDEFKELMSEFYEIWSNAEVTRGPKVQLIKTFTNDEFEELIANKKSIAKDAAEFARTNYLVRVNEYLQPGGVYDQMSIASKNVASQAHYDGPVLKSVATELDRLTLEVARLQRKLLV